MLIFFDHSKLGELPYVHHYSIDDRIQPVVHPPRRIPEALKPRVKKELQRLQSLNVITLVTEPTDWVSSLVTVIKPNGDVRLCLDPTHLNKAIRRPHYPLNTVDKVISHIPKAKIFTKLNAKSGFWQIKLTEESSKLCTFNTPWGRYRFLRMPFGTVDASETYQRILAESFEGLAEVSHS